MFVLMGNTMSKVTPAAEQYLFVHAHTVYFLNFFFFPLWFHLNETHTITPAETLTHLPVLTVQLAYTQFMIIDIDGVFHMDVTLFIPLHPCLLARAPLYNYTIFNFI